MNTMFKTSENANPNYLATICKITELYPIENSDRLLKTVVNGYDIVVSNDMKIGDIILYTPVESALCEGFLSANNLYDINNYNLNSNVDEVLTLRTKASIERSEGNIEEAVKLEAEAKSKVGFFNVKGRVRMIRLRGCPSMGFVTPVSSLVNYKKELENTDWESLVGTSFNYIGEDEFIRKYAPLIAVEQPHSNKKSNKRNKKLQKFDRLIEDKFQFHYDTQMLNNNMWKLNPNQIVTITVKVHGSSGIFANILCNRELSFWEKIKKFLGFDVKTTEYGNIYSSRNVIKNRYINKDAHDFYGRDVWGDVNEVIAPFIEKGMTVYGEIAGYVTGSDRMIQKNHDYGCEVGKWKFMPYRITTEQHNGEKFEWNVSEVIEWTNKIINENPDIADKLMPMTLLYHGRLGDLYPDIPEEQHWHENVLARMKEDKEHFLMEEDEPMCTMYNADEDRAKRELQAAKDNNMSKKDIKVYEKKLQDIRDKKAPREGIVIRIDNDPVTEAFKLKTLRHYGKEAEQHDAGEFDMEEIS